MNLVTVIELQELEIFKGKSESSIFSFLKTRGVISKGRGVKRYKCHGSAPALFDIEEVIEAYAKRPIKSHLNGHPQGLYYKRRTYKHPQDSDDFEHGGNAPFRNFKCPDYYECFTKAAKSTKRGRDSGILDCSKCDRKNIVDPKYLLQGVL